jgi:chlorite dismutase
MPYHSYIFFDIDKSITTLTKTNLEKGKKAFAACIETHTNVHVEAYVTLALKSGSRFMLHSNATTPDAIQMLVRDLLHTPLGTHLTIRYTLLGMTRTSQYSSKLAPKESVAETEYRYLIVYPFTKTPYEERREVMKAHVDVGRTYSASIAQLLLYSYGIDDHEFIVSYQTDSLEDFQSLVMDMRATESRRYTKNDLPIFTCIHMPLKDALDML